MIYYPAATPPTTVMATLTSGLGWVIRYGEHVPSDAEWTDLVNYVVSQGYPNSDVVGGACNALKSCRQVGSPAGRAKLV